MKVLVVGGGGREHALVWKIAQSPKVDKVFCAPGNGGISEIAECVPIKADDIEGLLKFAKDNAVGLTVVGPEDPLSNGITDRFEAEGLRIFGASKKAAQIEASKSFAKDLMNKYGIPTAEGRAFTDYDQAEAFIRKMGAPVVVKADGLAAGKGVIVCSSEDEALNALKHIMHDKAFGEAGATVVVEECLQGEEASFLAFTDGKTVIPLPSSQDHKPVFDGDKGPNTGGMGAYSPAPVIDRFLYDKVMKEVMVPTVKAMEAEGCPYKGVLYAGLMIDQGEIKVLEFNGRFGDPECQPLLMRLKSDIVPIMEAVIDGELDKCELEIDERATVCVVMAAGGYPGSYEKGLPISGLEEVKRMNDVFVFHAGTTKTDAGIEASGGRVLGVTALGDSVGDAIIRAYEAVSEISWKDVQFRKDIGQKALKRFEEAPQVGIVMGSDSDLPVMEAAVDVLKKFGISYKITVASAHRTPHKAMDFATSAREEGMKVIIAGAGHAAHLAGFMAAHSTLPVLGVPIGSSALLGLDALLATVQMPPGIPVATMAIGKPGAKNAAIFAVEIIGVSDPKVAEKLREYREEMVKGVEEKAQKLEQLL